MNYQIISQNIEDLKKNHIRSDFTHSKILGHCIAFGHDAPTIANDLFDKVEISEFINIHFVGSTENEYDTLINDTLGTSLISGRPFVIYHWQVIFSHCNKLYKNSS